MADNTTLSSGSGGDTIATDDIGGVKFQRVKIVEGADGSNDGDICDANPLPARISDGTHTADVNASSQLAVKDANSDAVAASLALLDNAISGNEMQCDIVAALPSGSNAIGKLASNNGVDIGDVTINNTSGASAVNVQDGGNSLTVDDGGSSLSVDDGGSSLTVDGTVGVSGEIDVTPASPSASSYLPVRVTDGSAFGLKSAGWDDSNPVTCAAIQGKTSTDYETILEADASNKYNITDVVVTVYTGSAAPGTPPVYLVLVHDTTEFLRVYIPQVANEVVNLPIHFRAPDKAPAVNKTVRAKLNNALGTNGEYSVTIHAYKTAS